MDELKEKWIWVLLSLQFQQSVNLGEFLLNFYNKSSYHLLSAYKQVLSHWLWCVAQVVIIREVFQMLMDGSHHQKFWLNKSGCCSVLGVLKFSSNTNVQPVLKPMVLSHWIIIASSWGRLIISTVQSCCANNPIGTWRERKGDLSSWVKEPINYQPSSKSLIGWAQMKGGVALSSQRERHKGRGMPPTFLN